MLAYYVSPGSTTDVLMAPLGGPHVERDLLKLLKELKWSEIGRMHLVYSDASLAERRDYVPTSREFRQPTKRKVRLCENQNEAVETILIAAPTSLVLPPVDHLYISSPSHPTSRSSVLMCTWPPVKSLLRVPRSMKNVVMATAEVNLLAAAPGAAANANAGEEERVVLWHWSRKYLLYAEWLRVVSAQTCIDLTPANGSTALASIRRKAVCLSIYRNAAHQLTSTEHIAQEVLRLSKDPSQTRFFIGSSAEPPAAVDELPEPVPDDDLDVYAPDDQDDGKVVGD
jgi:hypothetical protein